MEIEIDVKEKWWVADELVNGVLDFRATDLRTWGFRGEWTLCHPENSQLRAAVEEQWNKLRPPKENEWRNEFGDLVRFRAKNGAVECQYSKSCDDLWFPVERISPKLYEAAKEWAAKQDIVNGYEFRMGEFGVEMKYPDTWREMNPRIDVPDRIAAAREWMRRKGIRFVPGANDSVVGTVARVDPSGAVYVNLGGSNG